MHLRLARAPPVMQPRARAFRHRHLSRLRRRTIYVHPDRQGSVLTVGSQSARHTRTKRYFSGDTIAMHQLQLVC